MFVCIIYELCANPIPRVIVNNFYSIIPHNSFINIFCQFIFHIQIYI